MKLVSFLLVLLAAVHSCAAQSNSAVLMPGLGQHHHTISTENSEAQRYFDQGITLVFAFNHEESARAPPGCAVGSSVGNDVLGCGVSVGSLHQS